MIEQMAFDSATGAECKSDSESVLQRTSTCHRLPQPLLSCRRLALERMTERTKHKRCCPNVLSHDDRRGFRTENLECLLQMGACASKVSNMNQAVSERAMSHGFTNRIAPRTSKYQ